jgi:hypothetical protein
MDEFAEYGDLCPNTPEGVTVDEFGCPDYDGDGWNHNDCDNNNSEIYPGADEIEDSVDNDCDGLVDEVTPPLVITVEISPSDVFTNTNIECFGNSSTGDDVPLYIIINGVPFGYDYEWENYVILNSIYYTKGDIITCVAGYAETHIVWNRTIVANSPPELGGISLNQFNNGTIVCDISQANYIDPDGDSINFSYQWFIDGQLSEITNSYLLSSDYTFTEWADVTCIVTPNDGYIDGPAVSKTITMEQYVEDDSDEDDGGGSGEPDINEDEED